MALKLAVGGARKPADPPQDPSSSPSPAPIFEQSAFAESAPAQHPPMRGRMPPDLPLLSLLDKHLFKTRNRTNSRSRGVFHPSELDGCKRYLALDYIKAPMSPTELDARIYRIFENGDYVHKRLQRYISELCDSIGVDAWFRKELPVRHPELELDGSTDGVLFFKGYYYAVEIKSINSKGFEKLRKPEPKHVRQLNRYMGALGLWRGIVVYECKNSQAWKEFPVTFDNDLWQETLNVIAFVKDAVKQRVLPAREPSSNCRGCKFQKLCFENGGLSDEAVYALVGGQS